MWCIILTWQNLYECNIFQRLKLKLFWNFYRNNLEYKIGKLSYTGPGEGQLPKPIMIGVAVGAGVLLFIVIGILILYRRKSTESSRVLKNMQEVCMFKLC